MICLMIFLNFYMPGNIQDAMASFYQPKANINLKTVYNNGNQVIFWKIIPENIRQGYCLKFYDNNRYHCRINIRQDKSHEVSITLFNSSNELVHRSFKAFFPVYGFKVPFHMIDMDSLHQNKENFKIIQTAGGSKFSTLFNLSIKIITIKQAKENQWILPEFKSDKYKNDLEKLYLFLVKSETGKIILKQLWQENADWWLYEETETEKSWRK